MTNEDGVQAGFRYHHAESTYLMLTLWLPDEPCTLPSNASHQVGVGAFVMNDKNEVVMILCHLTDSVAARLEAAEISTGYGVFCMLSVFLVFACWTQLLGRTPTYMIVCFGRFQSSKLV